MYIFNTSKFARASWIYDVIVTSYEVQWYSFWYQWIEEVHTYTLVSNIGVSSVPYRKYREGVATTPLWRTCYKNTSGGRGLSLTRPLSMFSMLFCLILIFTHCFDNNWQFHTGTWAVVSIMIGNAIDTVLDIESTNSNSTSEASVTGTSDDDDDSVLQRVQIASYLCLLVGIIQVIATSILTCPDQMKL